MLKYKIPQIVTLILNHCIQMKFSDADYMGIAVGATYSLCNPHLNRKFMNLVWLIGCLSLFL